MADITEQGSSVYASGSVLLTGDGRLVNQITGDFGIAEDGQLAFFGIVSPAPVMAKQNFSFDGVSRPFIFWPHRPYVASLPSASRPNKLTAFDGISNPVIVWQRKPAVLASGTILPPLLVDADTFYSPTVSTSGGSGTTLLPSLFTDDDTFYAPSVTGGIATIQPPLFVDADTFYGPLVATGGDPIIIATARLDGEIKQ